MYSLRADKHLEGEYQSVVIWRLQIEDRTKKNTIQPLKRSLFHKLSPRFFIQGPETYKIGEIRSTHENWTADDDPALYDGLYIARAIPGNHKIYRLRIPFVLNSLAKNEWVDIPLDITITIPPDQLRFLGTFTIKNLQLVSWDKSPVFSYDMEFYKNDGTEAIRQFKQYYPEVYKQFQKTGPGMS
ncbi:MAG: hypothetical protein SWH61_06375 [Thermodesulfobacteriota bacterium]|nr:hypothetical protein [Thermodesulfobacteriota bacterium]